MQRICKYCGKEYAGTPDSVCCPACASAHRKTTLDIRTCKICGEKFVGGPRAWYCPVCHKEKEKEWQRRKNKNVNHRPLGSTDFCSICGAEYTVRSWRQKYCPKCAADAVKAIDNAQSRDWNAANINYDKQREERHESTAYIQCVVCGKLFKPSSGGNITCSAECAAINHKNKTSAWEKEHKDERNAYRRRRYSEKEKNSNGN